MTANTDDLPEGFIESDEQVNLTPDLIAKLRETASSRQQPTPRKSPKKAFGRRFDLEAASRCQAEWWFDLLRLWRPSGVEAGEHGLRLAVRDGYLNFYRKGQSIGRIGVAHGELTSDIHVKYVWPEQRASLGSEYLRLQGDTLYRRREPVAQYGGMSTLKAWIETAETTWLGKEKEAIDEVLDHTDNIIDLEMGQPGTALRMDMVSVERDADGLWVAFWEAKRARDGRVRCRAELDEVNEITSPHVIGQLRDYRNFIEASGNKQLVAAAYRNAAQVLVNLRKLADAKGPIHPLSPDIVAAANGSDLLVRPNARLLIFDDDPKDHAWRETHAVKLAAANIDIHTSISGQRLVWGNRV